MKKNVPVKKNKEYVIEIIGMGYQGEGIGKVENFTVFVQGALLGEIVKVNIVKITKNFAFGKLLEIKKFSLHRVKPVCEIYEKCGGCQLQHYSYKAQIKFKTNRVKECIERISKVDKNNLSVYDTIGMDNPYNYRNKVQLPVGLHNKQVVIGFYKKRSHEIVDMSNCYIQNETSNLIVNLIKKWISKYNISIYNEDNHDGNIRHIVIRKAFKTGQIMLIIVTKEEKISYKKELINLMSNSIKGLSGIIQNINNEKTNVILGKRCNTLWGKDSIIDYIGNFKFNISPLSFFQINPVQTEILYNKVLEYANLTGNETIFDAYCGTGTISLFLSKKSYKVYGVEIIAEAICNAKQNAQINNVDNVEFIVGKSEKVIPNLIKDGINADVVVVDPPRKGCEKNLLYSIVKMQPKRIVYVSCDPATLARDLGILDELGYITLKIQPVDMFPQTSHVENVALIVKNE